MNKPLYSRSRLSLLDIIELTRPTTSTNDIQVLMRGSDGEILFFFMISVNGILFHFVCVLFCVTYTTFLFSFSFECWKQIDCNGVQSLYVGSCVKGTRHLNGTAKSTCT